MDALEFEQAYADRSGITVKRLRELDRIAIACSCDQEECDGWEMVNQEEYLQGIDASIAKHIMGWEFTRSRHGWFCTCQRCGRSSDECGGSCEYSDDIASAYEVVKQMRIHGWFAWYTDLTMDSDTEWHSWHFTKHESVDQETVCVYAETLPLAICLAALKAMKIAVVI